MKLISASFSGRGPGKAENEDSVLAPVKTGPNSWVSAIADGVGGYAGGAGASQIAIGVIASWKGDPAAPDVPVVFREVQQEIRQAAAEEAHLARMATTLSVVWIYEFGVIVGHVGDTRIYHLRAGGLMNRTIDQTEVQRLLDEGVLTPTSAKKYPRRNVLLSALSAASEFDLEISTFALEPGDRILLLTDGVHSKVTRGRISNLSQAANSAETLCEMLRQEVESAGAEDDYSAVCIEVAR